MRPNLSVEKIAGALAILGTSVVMAACGGEPAPNTPVNANETAAPTSGAAKPAEGSCGAAGHKPGEGSCGAAKAAGDTKAADTKAADAVATPAAATPTDTKAAVDPTKPAEAKAADTKAGSDPKKDDKKKPGAPAAPTKKGAASCGAGTCSAKK